MLQFSGLAAFLCLSSLLQLGTGYRILALCPTPSISHQVVFRGLTLALNKRGHELVVVTTDPINDPTLTNYTEINISFGYAVWSSVNFIENRGKLRWIDTLSVMQEKILQSADQILSQPELLKLYAPNSDEKFDLLLMEMVWWPSMYPLATRFGIPMRLKHFFTIWRYLYWYNTAYVRGHEEIARKHFGNDIPNLSDLAKNVSLLLVNQQQAISYAGPNVPKVIEIGGFHVSKEYTRLSKELQVILDEATQGFVYMSLGSNAKSNLMPNRTIEQFMTAFSRLPYKVLWKFEDDSLPGKPDNVHIMKWVPQQAVLAHPNLKVFIYQGGVQSTEEALYHGVPLIGFPVLGDQDMQMTKMASLGVGIKLEIRTVDAEELFEAISTVTRDTSYKQRMLNLRSLNRDKPHDPLENAIWWIEHVIRHKGASQLHSKTADVPWYSRQDMDIVALISTGFVIVMGLTLIISLKLVKCIIKICTKRSIDPKKTN